ncbi:MAG: GNAT family N-acetyltransferase [Pirellulaceae bacterium]|nr:GNAT family N-acetyltransferase [Pirellulaceae bacterium]
MQVRLFENFDDLASWADDWDRLSDGVPFRGWIWASTWWRHYGESTADCRLAVLGVFNACGSLIGVAPWYVAGERGRRRVIRFLGAGEVCSDHLTLLAMPDQERVVVGAIAQWLLRANESSESAPGDALPWDHIELIGVDADDPRIELLAEHLERSGCAVHRRPGTPCMWTDLPDGFDAFVSRLSKTRRQKMRRLKRTLLDSGRAERSIVTYRSQLDPALDDLIELHQRRHRSLGRPGCHASAAFEAFLRDVAARQLAVGQLQLHSLWVDRKPIAAEYQLTGNGVMYAYQTGIDPTRLDLEPGHAMQLASLDWAMRQGYRMYDFLRGDEPYKSFWNARRRDTVEVRVAAPRLGARLRHATWVTGAEVKKWMRQGWNSSKEPRE